MTLFTKYGGVPGVNSIIKAFYKEALKDPQVGKYFARMDVAEIVDHQIKFVSFLLGKSSQEYTADYLFEAHRGLYISDTAYTDVVHIFKDVLLKHQMEINDVSAVLATLESLRRQIVGLPSSPRRV
jgi:hemoglobin